MHAGTYFNLPQTGPGQTWDYSIVGGGGGFSYVFDHASGDPQAESFPNADLVRTGDGNSYFHSTSEEGVFFHGHISDFGNLSRGRTSSIRSRSEQPGMTISPACWAASRSPAATAVWRTALVH
jgi:hypothetical protein